MPLSELHLLTVPGVRSEMLRELWIAAHAYSQRSDQFVYICLFASPRPNLDAKLEGDSSKEPIMGTHYRRGAQKLSLGEELASEDPRVRGPARIMGPGEDPRVRSSDHGARRG